MNALRAHFGISCAILPAAGLPAAACLAIYLVWQGEARWLVTALLILLLLMMSARSLRFTALAALAYLFFLGDFRRILDALVGPSALDPLLLVVPIVSGVLAWALFLRNRSLTPIARMVLGLMVIMTAEIFNPLQGGLAVGLGGALFYLVPLFWFWLGRSCASPAFVEKAAYQLVLPVAVFASIVGLMQTFVGFAPWEQAWINRVQEGYHALGVGGIVRPFAFFTSAASYSTFIALGATIAAVGWWLGRRSAVIWLLILLPALFLASSRGVVVKLVLALLVVWALRRGGSLGWYLRFSFGAIFLIATLSWVLPKLTHADQDNVAVQALVAHQVAGLTNPLDSQDSTLQLHLYYLGQGLISGFIHPLGQGLGASTGAVKKFGGEGQSSEVDFGDMFIDLGFFGGLLYLALMAAVLRQVWQRWRAQRERTALLILGVLVVTGGAWLIGGQYEISALVWLLIGAASHEGKQDPSGSAPQTRHNSPELLRERI